MKTQTTQTGKMQVLGARMLTMVTALLLFTACQKGVETPVNMAAAQVATTSAAFIGGFRIAEPKVIMNQGNEEKTGINFSWNRTATDNLRDYTIEAAAEGTHFEAPVELGTTDGGQVSFLVKDLNQKMCKLIPAGTTGKVELRVKAYPVYGKSTAVYSDAVALNVTTYLHYTEYAYPRYMKMPGNYQNWDLATAPQLVSVNNDGEYEGYVSFGNNYPQFMFVKGTQWEKTNTFTHIGNSKFGFGGGVLAVFGGAGTYLVKASTNTNSWSYTKINNWGIHGTAVAGNPGTDPVMSYDEASKAYVMGVNLQAGTFRFRANNDNAVTLGKEVKDGYEVPVAGGADFTVATAGYYNIYLKVDLAGNYACTVAKQATPAVNGK